MSQGKTRVVLAHGAWADGSSWSKVIERLSRHGVDAVAAPLPLTSLRDDVAALGRTLERIEGPVVLAGHAYAGAVIGAIGSSGTSGTSGSSGSSGSSGPASAANVAALVYVAALAPDEGETVADVFHRGKAHPLAPLLAPDAHGWIWLPREAFATAFAQLATPEEAAGLAAIQRPIAAASIGEAVGRPLWRDRPAWFLVAGEDRMIDPDTQRFMASRMNAHIRAHDVDHTPSVTAPDVVVEVILEAVQSAPTR